MDNNSLQMQKAFVTTKLLFTMGNDLKTQIFDSNNNIR